MTDPSNDDESDPGAGLDRGEFVYSIGDNERPSAAVVRAVAAVTDTPILELDPLYRVVDPEHLDGLVEAAGEDTNADSSMSFAFAGCTVTVTASEVHVRERGENARRE